MKTNLAIVDEFFAIHQIERAIVKPIAGGSSIDVHSVQSAKQAKCVVETADTPMMIEPFCTGREFTIIVLQDHKKQPVALVPTEIQISYENDAIFDYRCKYLPTNHTMWACPPNFPDYVIQKIRHQAEQLFTTFQARDFVRMDGWYLDDGKIIFTDFNPLSGMEQNSFIFQQASRIGMTHQDLLQFILGPLRCDHVVGLRALYTRST